MPRSRTVICRCQTSLNIWTVSDSVFVGWKACHMIYWQDNIIACMRCRKWSAYFERAEQKDEFHILWFILVWSLLTWMFIRGQLKNLHNVYSAFTHKDSFKLITTTRKLINIRATYFTHADFSLGAYHFACVDFNDSPCTASIRLRPTVHEVKRWRDICRSAHTWANRLWSRKRHWHMEHVTRL